MSALDHGLNEHWALTLQIPAFKKINYGPFYKAYDQFPEEDQKGIIESYFRACFTFFNMSLPELYFERHKDGRIHCHTYVYMTYDKIYAIQKKFCEELLRIRPKQFQQVFNLFRPDSIENWVKYCKKHSGSKIQLEYDLAHCGNEFF